jgi:L-iditol 2-dehydrogenase
MKTDMVGLYKTQKGDGFLELRTTKIPKPMANEVLVEIKAAGICGTDIHIKHDQFPYWPPVILGHEYSGVIVETGKEVEKYKVNDRVIGEPHTRACGKCELCRSGNIQLCSQKRSPGWGIDGAFAKYLTVPEHLLHKIPDSMTFEEAALIEPTANAVQDVLERGQVVANDTVVVIGPGPIGLLSIGAAKAGGAGKVIAIGTSADEAFRLPVALAMGADTILMADKQDIVSEVMRLTDNRGADLVVEASGSTKGIQSAVKMVKRLGRISQIGLPGKENIDFPWDAAAWKVCTIIFNLSTAFSCWDRSIGLVASKKIDVSKVISHKLPLSDWEKAFELVEKAEGLKVLLIP